MSGYLLDTHVLIWWLSEPDRLPPQVHEAISNPETAIFVSAAVAWEMAIKKSIGRLEMPSNLPEVLAAESISVLDINIHHALAVADLPRIHEDPFDRLQIAQARLEDLALVTHDAQIHQYEVPLLRV